MVHKNRFIVECVFDTWNERDELLNILGSLGAGNLKIETPQEWRARLKEEEMMNETLKKDTSKRT